MLCLRNSRRVARDNTVRIPLAADPTSALGRNVSATPGSRVEVIEHINGRLQVAFAGKVMPSQLCPVPGPGLMRIDRADSDPGRLQLQLENVEQLPRSCLAKKRSRCRHRVGSNHRRQPTARQLARWRGGAGGQCQGNEHQRHRQGARDLAKNGAQIRESDRAAVQPVTSSSGHHPATITRTRRLTFLLDSWTCMLIRRSPGAVDRRGLGPHARGRLSARVTAPDSRGQ